MSSDTRTPLPDNLVGPDLYRAAIDPIWDLVTIYEGPATFLRGFASVHAPQGLLWAAHFAQSEICNGGHYQFFWNSTGVLAPEAVRGFEHLEMASTAAIVRRAVAMFGEAESYPRDHERRMTALEALERPGHEREQWDPFYALDEAFYAGDGGRFAEKASAFVRGHLDQFFRV